ncbi:glycosyltransferase [Flavobacterium plurextorum]|mgnify:CR=1 FL=1|uniref:glycosyltransferase n=1 Tax=Flavobacterium TaxID=237 RepID=UPI00214D743B|nr:MULTISPECIES: glycosyltransferase [Flavobacterium]UUW09500.1 glycosyltransferase [Flavobacterium plurextorum]
MKNLKIGIAAEQFITWGGGIDFIRLILNGLTSVQRKKEYEINLFVYVPVQSNLKIRFKNLIKKLINPLFSSKYLLNKTNIDLTSIINTFKAVNSSITIVKYNGTKEDLAKKTVKDNISFLLPLFSVLPADFPVQWAGYIYDFQHKYYPEFFTNEEIQVRDEHFSTMMKEAKKIIVNAKAVKNDVEKFIEFKNAKVMTLPFCPVLNHDFFEHFDVTKYNLPAKYFMISNQFWIHKDHRTAFKAFKVFIDETGDNEIGLVCSGQVIDYRFPNYFSELEQLIEDLGLSERIIIVGYIPKKHQLQILKDSIAVIQPTLFEGGPGGGAVYESVAYAIPSIVSDIPVNLELDDESVTFFNAGSFEDLASKMKIVYKQNNVKYTFEELKMRNEKRMLSMGQQIIQTILD